MIGISTSNSLNRVLNPPLANSSNPRNSNSVVLVVNANNRTNRPKVKANKLTMTVKVLPVDAVNVVPVAIMTNNKMANSMVAITLSNHLLNKASVSPVNNASLNKASNNRCSLKANANNVSPNNKAVNNKVANNLNKASANNASPNNKAVNNRCNNSLVNNNPANPVNNKPLLVVPKVVLNNNNPANLVNLANLANKTQQPPQPQPPLKAVPPLLKVVKELLPLADVANAVLVSPVPLMVLPLVVKELLKVVKVKVRPNECADPVNLVNPQALRRERSPRPRSS